MIITFVISGDLCHFCCAHIYSAHITAEAKVAASHHEEDFDEEGSEEESEGEADAPDPGQVGITWPVMGVDKMNASN